jgi:hypothetical protein
MVTERVGEEVRKPVKDEVKLGLQSKKKGEVCIIYLMASDCLMYRLRQIYMENYIICIFYRKPALIYDKHCSFHTFNLSKSLDLHEDIRMCILFPVKNA